MSSTLVILVSVTTVAILSGEASAALPTQCNTGFLEELPPRLRKLCFAIARLWDARDSNDFVDDSGKRSSSESYLAHPRFIKLFLYFSKPQNGLRERIILRVAFELLSEYRENLPRYASGVKRQDVDHVFLRFGKRR